MVAVTSWRAKQMARDRWSGNMCTWPRLHQEPGCKIMPPSAWLGQLIQLVRHTCFLVGVGC
jgi:hypothetical protein